MQVSVEKVSNIVRRLTISIPATNVEEAFSQHLVQFAKKANIKGFRPGKVPMSYIAQHFGAQARNEALSEVIQKALHDALIEQKLRPISTPQIEPKMMEPNKPLEFVASFEVLPDIDKVHFKLDQIEQPIVEIKTADIEHVIDQLRKQHTAWKEVERPAQLTDRVVIDYHGIFEGNADLENKIAGFPLELGSHTMLPGFEEGLVGATVGEEKKLSLTFPDDFAVKDKAGKKVDFVIQVKQILEANVPALDEDFVKKLGLKTGSEEELREQIKQTLEIEKTRLIKEKVKEKVFNQLLADNPLDVPNALIQSEAERIHHELYPQHKHDNNEGHSQDELAAFTEVAKKRVALGLLLAHYSQQADLKVDKERVKQRIGEIASAYENPAEVVKWLGGKEGLKNVEAQVMEDQVVETLLKDVTSIEKEMSYAELKGIRI